MNATNRTDLRSMGTLYASFITWNQRSPREDAFQGHPERFRRASPLFPANWQY
jgi:hypothetical protein